MSTLNVVNKSPFEKRSLEQCLSRVSAGDGLLLTEDAVAVAVANTSYEKSLLESAEKVQMYVLEPDLAARGFGESKLVNGFKSIDYKGFVALVTEHDRVHSWL